MIRLGSTVAGVRVGSTPATRVYVGSTVVWSAVQAVTITTTGASFAPVVELVGGSAATVHWEWSGGSTTGTAPTISFGSAATRTVTMTITESDGADAIGDARALNLGFNNAQDEGEGSTANASRNHATQAVTGVGNVRAMTGLVFFACNNAGFTGAMDFTGMAALEYIECYMASLTGVTLTGCTSLIRLCLEENHLTTLNLAPVAATLRDLRAAYQRDGAGLTFTALGSGVTMAALWHYCVRDQPVTGHFTLAQMPVLTQLWNWNTGQTGVLACAGNTTLQEARSYGNAYTGASNIPASIQWFDLSHDASLTQSNVDAILTALNALNTSGARRVDLSSTTAPSSASSAARTALTGRGWTVVVDAGATAPTVTTTSLAAMTQGAATSQTLAATGSAAITWAVTAGALPAGLSLSSGGVLSGTPTGSGAYSFTVTATNSAGSDDQAYTGTITDASWSYSDLFDTARADLAAMAADGWSSPHGATATVSGGNLNKTSSGSYQLLLQSGGGGAPADYEIETVIPHSQRNTGFSFVALRWAGGNGVRVGYGGSIVFGDANAFNGNDQSGTTDGGFPASWSTDQDHTVRVRAVGTLIQLYLDGTLAAHATIAINATATGTSFGVGGGNASTYRSLTAQAA